MAVIEQQQLQQLQQRSKFSKLPNLTVDRHVQFFVIADGLHTCFFLDFTGLNSRQEIL